jgi:Tat protein secretion system quality control protein TatD with DNase activity
MHTRLIIPPSVREALRNQADEYNLFPARLLERQSERMKREPSYKAACLMVGRDFPGKPILHWFSGSFVELEEAAANGFFFSVGLAMVRSRRGQELIKRMPSGKVLTESDGPFTRVGACLRRAQQHGISNQSLGKDLDA